MVIMVISESKVYQSEQTFFRLIQNKFWTPKNKIPFDATHININC